MLFRPFADFLHRLRGSRGSRKRTVTQLPLCERLEERLLLSVDAVMVKDINTQLVTQGSFPGLITNVNGTAFFIAATRTSGNQLWKSDGTTSGTTQVYDGDVHGGSYPTQLTNVKGILYYQVYDSGRQELWRSDGTEAGTRAVSSATFATLNSLTNVNGTLYFKASEQFNGPDSLWRSDGTEVGTVKVKDFPTSSYSSSSLSSLTNVNGRLYFTVTSSTFGNELWTVDGSNFATQVADIVPGSGGSFPSNLTNVNGTLYFSATDSSGDRELWRLNGNSVPTKVKDIRPGQFGSAPSDLTNVNGTLFFIATDGVSGRELWKSDGTDLGTVQVKDISAGALNSDLTYLTASNATLFFVAKDSAGDQELWKSDGTAAGTVRVKDINPGTNGSAPVSLTDVNGTLFFSASDGQGDRDLWKSDGTAAGTIRVKDINPGVYSSYPGALTNVNGVLYFSADDGSSGRELWKSDGTAAGTVRVKDIRAGNDDSSPYYLTNVGGKLVFAAYDPVGGTELWKSDGTSAGTSRITDIVPGMIGSSPQYLTVVNGIVYFTALSSATGDRELWKSDTTAAGTVRVADINLGPNGSSPHYLTNVNGKLFFSADNGAYGNELWVSDGTQGGTVLVKDIYLGANSSNPRDLTNVNGVLYFVADNGIYGEELWKSDGTAAGTVLVKDIVPGADESDPNFLTNVNGILYFGATDGAYGFELWKSDGTTAGTVMVKDINPGSEYSNPKFLTNVNGILYFIADDGAYGEELWKSDGTVAGTVLVKDIAPGSYSPQIEGEYLPGSDRYFLFSVNGTLYFTADDGDHGRELWKSDGTAAGTMIVKDVAPGGESSNPYYLSNVSGTLFFTAYNGSSYELYKSDGTEAGTAPFSVTFAGGTSFLPKYLTVVNNTVFFAIATDANGEELWRLNSSNSAPTDIALSSTSIAENNSTNATVGTFSSTDPDVGNAFTYTFATGDGSEDNGAFSLTNNTLKLTAPANYEAKNAYFIRIKVTDQGGLSFEKQFKIDVLNVNEPPSLTLTNTTTSLSENTNLGSALKVANIVVSDDALGANALSLSGNDSSMFQIVGNELRLKAGSVLDFDTNPVLDVTVQVDDPTLGGAPDGAANLSITVTAVNQPPSVALTNTTTALAENTILSPALKVANIVVSDDGLGSNTLSLSGNDSSMFQIVGNELRLKAGSTLDFETNPILEVTVQVDDPTLGGNPDGTASLSISVSNVNELPSVTLTNTTTSLSENTNLGSALKVANIVVSDDALGANALSLSGNDSSMFQIVGNELRLKAGSVLDFDTNPVLDVTVQVDDPTLGGNPDGTANLSISITTVNQPPSVTLTNTTTALAENTILGSALKVANIVVSDDGLGSNTLSLSGNDSSMFQIVGNELRLKAGSLLDFETNPVLEVTVRVDDPTLGGNPDSMANLSISVSNVNELPSVTLTNTTTSLAENVTIGSGLKVANIVVSDDALGSNTLTLSGNDASVFQIVGNELRLKAGSILDFGANPVLDVTVQVDDPTVGGSPDGMASLSISIIDTAPTFNVLDVDGSGGVPDGFTDGALLFGYLAGASDVKLAKLIAGGATRSLAQIHVYLDSLKLGTTLDVDGSGGEPDGFTDGALLFGYLAGASDVKLAKLISGGATRSLAQIHTYLDQLLLGNVTAPVNNLPGAQSISQNELLTFSSANSNAISITDAAVGSSPIEVSLNIIGGGGTLSLSNTSGLTFSSGTGSNNAAMKFQGTLAAVNSAFSGAIFQPATGFNGIANIQIVSSDLGHGGGGGPITASGSVSIAVGAAPGSTLTIAGNFNPSLETIVTFSVAGGLTFETSATSVSTQSVSVTVPPYVDFLANPPSGESAFVRHGAVTITVKQIASGNPVDRATVSAFQIAKLPQTGSPPGTVTSLFMNGLLEIINLQIQNANELQLAAGGNNSSLASLIATLQASLQKVTSLQQQIQPLLNGQATSIEIATINGRSIVLNQESLTYIDECLGAIFVNDPLASGMPPQLGMRLQSLALSSLTAGDSIDDSLKSIIGSIKGNDFISQANDAVGRFRSSMGVVGSIATGVAFLALGPEIAVASAVCGALLFMAPTLAQLANSVTLQGGMNSIINGNATVADLQESIRFAASSVLDVGIGESIKALGRATAEAPLGTILGETAEAARNVYDAYTKGTGTSDAVANYLVSAYNSLRIHFGNPTIGVSQTSFTFKVTANGPESEPQVFTVSNDGSGTLSWTATPSQSNFHFQGGGQLEAGEQSSIMLTVDGNNLSVGTHTGTITVTDPNSTNQSVTITITINVVAGVISASAPTLSFSGKENGSDPPDQTLVITNAGDPISVLHWTYDFTPRVHVFGNVPSLTAGASATLTVGVSTTGLAAGVYTDFLTLRNTDNPAQTVTITITTTVIEELDFTGTFFGTFTSNKVVTEKGPVVSANQSISGSVRLNVESQEHLANDYFLHGVVTVSTDRGEFRRTFTVQLSTSPVANGETVGALTTFNQGSDALFDPNHPAFVSMDIKAFDEDSFSGLLYASLGHSIVPPKDTWLLGENAPITLRRT